MVEDMGFVRRQKRQQLLEAVVAARERKVARHRRVVGRGAAVGEDSLRRLARRARVGRERHGRERHGRERARRPLRVGVERPDRGDGVQVELDAHGFREMRREDVEKTPADGEIAGLGHEIGALVALVEERLDDARGRHLVACRERQRALPEVIRRRQAPEKGSRRDDEEIHPAFREARQRPELLAPHFQRRRDLLVRRERGRREESHALLAENARARRAKRRQHRARARTRRAISARAARRRPRGGTAGGRGAPPTETRFPSTSRGPPPRSARPDAAPRARRRASGTADPSAASRRGLWPPPKLMRLDYCDERALPSV